MLDKRKLPCKRVWCFDDKEEIAYTDDGNCYRYSDFIVDEKVPDKIYLIRKN